MPYVTDSVYRYAPFDEMKRSAEKNTLLMAQDALDKLRHGHTNLEELIRTLPYACLHQFRRMAQQGLLTVAKRAS